MFFATWYVLACIHGFYKLCISTSVFLWPSRNRFSVGCLNLFFRPSHLLSSIWPSLMSSFQRFRVLPFQFSTVYPHSSISWDSYHRICPLQVSKQLQSAYLSQIFHDVNQIHDHNHSSSEVQLKWTEKCWYKDLGTFYKTYIHRAGIPAPFSTTDCLVYLMTHGHFIGAVYMEPGWPG
jgi:hypothetical protein